MELATVFYILGGVLVVAALATSFLGLRSERFPGSPRAVVGMLALVGVVVIATGAVVIQVSAEEGEHRAEEIAEIEEDPGDTEANKEDTNRDPGGAEADEGATIFTDAGCANCHALSDAGASAQVGPSLDDALQGETPEFVRTSIVDPDAEIEPGYSEGVMPANYEQELTPEQLDVLVAYLSEVGGADG